MKTIKQWLESIEDKKVRKQALKNTGKRVLKHIITFPSLERAIVGAFLWSDSPEGFEYWMIKSEEL